MPVRISRTLKELQDAAGDDQSMNLYDLDEQTYKKLRYGIKVSEPVVQYKTTIQFVGWEHPFENDFYIAEEIIIKHRCLDLVLYINGITFAYKMSRPNVQKILYKNVQLVCLS